MKNIPDKIYLVIDTGGNKVKDFKELHDVSWCSDRINKEDIPFFRKGKGYNDEDMVSFANMVSMYECDPETGLYFLLGQKYIKVVHKTTECLLRIWEEKK